MQKYDAVFIKGQIEKFRLGMSEWDGDRHIYFDADNTLYKFSTYKLSDVALQQCYTKCIDSPYCYNEKMESFRYYFPMIDYKDIHLLSMSEDKTMIMPDVKHSVLVDDYYVNLNEMYAAGGIGIKKSYSGKERPVPVVKSLIDLFPILHDLKVF